jgi:hypothetical protein
MLNPALLCTSTITKNHLIVVKAVSVKDLVMQLFNGSDRGFA